MDNVVALTQELIRRPSVTPDDQGCQTLLRARLEACGFTVESLRFGAVDNLWARHGQQGPLVTFLGHTDVVPPGPLEAWTSPPFSPEIRDGVLYGRGAADMKGAVAAFTLALIAFVEKHPDHPGSVGLLLTSDEEGVAQDGTRRVMEILEGRGEHIDYCIVGEPSSCEQLGDTIKHGRRGSLTGILTVHGVQGHIAYPERCDNPIARALPALAELAASDWDQGNADFPATRLQFSNIHAGTGADNVIPSQLETVFNFRFAASVTADVLRRGVAAVLDRHGLRYDLTWRLSGQPFLTREGPLLEALTESIQAATGIRPQRSTAGGTSDGRFVAPFGSQVLEFGPLNGSIHKIDEGIPVADLPRLQTIYEDVLERLLVRQRPDL
ncbi:MAG: succinyl-diaminopimelate desuccinylase [Gammaproteobacteria bacterium]|nr:succinyl-diaminopimelate desuccinylase [Gammaproteobacteria bacterium]